MLHLLELIARVLYIRGHVDYILWVTITAHLYVPQDARLDKLGASISQNHQIDRLLI